MDSASSLKMDAYHLLIAYYYSEYMYVQVVNYGQNAKNTSKTLRAFRQHKLYGKILVSLPTFGFCHLSIWEMCFQILIATATDTPVAAPGLVMGAIESSFAKAFDISLPATSQQPGVQRSFILLNLNINFKRVLHCWAIFEVIKGLSSMSSELLDC